VIYLSCIATAKGKHLDKRTFPASLQDKEWLSEWRVAREEPTPQDWILWEDLWHEYCNHHFELPLPLGQWEYPGHRLWPWFLNKEQIFVYWQSYQSIHAYTLLAQGHTKSGGMYIYLEEVTIIPIKVAPITVNKVEPDDIKIRGGGLALPPCLQQETQTFWDSLYQGGDTWMWDYMLDMTSELS
jgi:hypothetical protein